jgi:glycolate oxidase
VVTDPEILETYRHDQAAPGLITAGVPIAVARPRESAEVAAVMRVAAAHGLPVVARGAGSGLSGGANAVDGGLVLSTERMTRLVELDVASLTATVQAGVINADLKSAAAAAGLFYAPDPASFEFSTIGGNVATNAGGLCCVKYGVTRDALLGLEAVLADGRVVRVGRRTRKGVAGYDLAALLCGSEGTLAVITEVTVRLLPAPAPASTLAASFPTLRAACDAVAAIVHAHQPSLLEVMDATTIAAVAAQQPIDLGDEDAALLFAASDVAGGADEVADIEKLCEAAGASFVATSQDPAEGRMLLAARRLAYPSLERMGTTLLDDVAVPLGRLHELLDAIPAIGLRHDVVIATFGHAGDGNMHPTIVYDHSDGDAARRAGEAFVEIVELTLSLGGTVTGEHGVGVLKRDLLARELGDAHDLHRLIKNALDPHGLLNPGKAL